MSVRCYQLSLCTANRLSPSVSPPLACGQKPSKLLSMATFVAVISTHPNNSYITSLQLKEVPSSWWKHEEPCRVWYQSGTSIMGTTCYDTMHHSWERTFPMSSVLVLAHPQHAWSDGHVSTACWGCMKQHALKIYSGQLEFFMSRHDYSCWCNSSTILSLVV